MQVPQVRKLAQLGQPGTSQPVGALMARMRHMTLVACHTCTEPSTTSNRPSERPRSLESLMSELTREARREPHGKDLLFGHLTAACRLAAMKADAPVHVHVHGSGVWGS